MREMKDSGIEWIGDVPHNWQLVRIKVCVSRRDSGAWGEEATGEPGDCVCIRVADMDYDRLRLKDNLPFTYRNYEEKVIESLKLADGDILIEKSGGGEKTLVGRAVMFHGTIQAVFANFMERIRCRDFVRSRFLLYILAVLYQSGYIKNYIKQTTGIQNLDISSIFSKEYLALPPLVAQDRIADYLDRKCSQIDAIIARQQEVIEKLKAYKLSVITEAITKGLNPDVPMKDSGVEWIGEIPEHWNVAKMKFVAAFFNGDRSSKYPSGTDIVDTGVIFVTSNNLGNIVLNTEVDTKYITKEKYKDLGGAKLQIDDIVFCLRGSVGKCSINKTENEGTIASSLVAIRAEKILADYLIFVLQCPGVTAMSTLNAIGIGSLNLSAEDISEIVIPVPSQEDTKQIAAFLEKKIGMIDKLISTKKDCIDKLTSYKKSLIYEVVTGKKEV